MYTPNNSAIYTAAFAGAMAGIAAANRPLTDTAQTDYDFYSTVAGNFAQEFDTVYASNSANSLDVILIEEACCGYWTDKAPNVGGSFPPSSFTLQCQSLLAILNSARAYFAGQNITPPPFGPGGNESWKQATWFVDPANVSGKADDNNSGIDATHPVLSYNGGIVTKWGTTSPVLEQSVTFTWMSSQVGDTDPVILTPILSGTGVIIMQGAVPTAAHTGVLAGVVAKDRATGQILEADLGYAAPIGTKVVNTTAGKSSVAFVYQNVSGTVFALSQPATPQVPPTLHLAVNVDTWANGDTFATYVPIAVDLVRVGADVVTAYPSFSEWIEIYRLTALDPNGLGSGASSYIGANVAVTECVFERTLVLQPSDDPSFQIIPNNAVLSDAYSGGGTNGMFFGGGMLLSLNGSDVSFGFIRDAVVDSTAAAINMGSSEVNGGFQLGSMYINGTVNVSGTSAGAIGAVPGGETLIWGRGTLNITETCRCYYGTGATAGADTFTCTGGIQLNGAAFANKWDEAAGTFGTTTALTAAALDNPSDFGGRAINVGGACFTNEGSI